MTVNMLKDQLQSLFHTTRRRAVQVGSAARAGAAKAGHTTESALAYTRLRVHAMELKGQVKDRLRNIGELVYATHTGTPADSEEMQHLLQEVDALKAAIARDEAKMAQLKGIRLCPDCGSPVSEGHAFCQECGRSLEGSI